jgi:spermidine synthase
MSQRLILFALWCALLVLGAGRRHGGGGRPMPMAMAARKTVRMVVAVMAASTAAIGMGRCTSEPMNDIPETNETDAPSGAHVAILLLSVLVVATCGLIYELLAGTLASYLLGDSVTQFSTVIGTYLFAMGVGSYLSRFVRGDELGAFIRVEVMIAMLGGWSAAGLFLAYPLADDFRVLLYALVLAIGVLVGLEIPLLIRILRGRFAFRDLVSNVLTYDYVGALIASLAFPLFLVPHLGMIRTGMVFGLANIAVAIALLIVLRRQRRVAGDLMAAGLVALSLIAGLAMAERIQRYSEVAYYGEG